MRRDNSGAAVVNNQFLDPKKTQGKGDEPPLAQHHPQHNWGVFFLRLCLEKQQLSEGILMAAINLIEIFQSLQILFPCWNFPSLWIFRI